MTGKTADTDQIFFSEISLASETGTVQFSHSSDTRIGSKSMASGVTDSSGKPYLLEDEADALTVKSLSDLQLEYSDPSVGW